MSPTSTPHKANATHFKEIQKFSTEYSPTTITQYESTRTGMRIVIVDKEGPKVDGLFTLATEIHDDSGAPHTLEHLCFMGSKSYQYKGMLDKLATRAYSYTNAYTATDHTAYELSTAGWEGFAQILPVYLEHIVAPTLTDASCYTEIHHVDGSGNDAGVVYSEMQAEENQKGGLMWRKSKRLLYPEGVGFRYETFGMMESLRALSAHRIREFQHDMYQPKNLCLVIVGAVDHVNLLDVLEHFEGTILEDIPKPGAPFSRPWLESKQTLPLEKSTVEYVEFPEADESSGEILMNFFGPDLADNLLCGAMNVLLRYLAGSSASVLDNTLVEKEQIASGVFYECEYRPKTVIQFTLTGVATEELEQVEARFHELLRETAAKPIDLEYMKDCTRREKRQVKFYAESSGGFFTEPIVKDFLFGKRDGSTLKADLENLGEYDTLETWEDSQWRHWLRVWMSEAHHISVIGKPSAALPDKIESREKARIAARKERLGVEGLEDLSARLAAAKAENDKEVPKEVLEQFEVPNTSSIHFINTTTARAGAARNMGSLQNPAQQVIDKDSDLPVFLHFEHVQSNFVYLTLVLGTEAIPVSLRPLLTIYMEGFFSTPMLRDGKTIGFEQVIMELERDTVGYAVDSGQPIGNPEVVTIRMQVEVEKYQTAIHWLRELMYSSIFDLDRVKSITSRLLADIPDEKRDGDDMRLAAELMVGTAPSSITRACNTLVGAVYLKRVKNLLKKDPEAIINQLKDINSALCQPDNWRILVVGNVEKLPHPVASWNTLTTKLDNGKSLKPLDTRLSRLSEQGKSPGNSAYVIPMPSLDSSFAIAVGKGPSSYDDHLVPALMVATAYLNNIEGPVSAAARGRGLAYTVSFRHHVGSGQVSLDISRSPNAFVAFVAIKEVMRSFALGERVIDPLDLESAVSSVVLGFANAEATMASAAEISFVRQVMRGLPKDWPTIILERVRNVTSEDFRDLMRNVLLPIFEGRTSNLVVTCAPIMEKEIVQGFRGIGFEAEVKPLDFFQDDYGLEGGGKDEDENDQDGEDEDEDEEEDGEDDNFPEC
ncbi:hypothetical protein HO133_008669 [Letharia lupina]|uniref:Zinc metalloprotease n=1 Tax=Letharia lupina TaxID=560253 RepID=A0A8H6FG30_9LECA|nr:uncharacterized protein HO133_008669 [Letharia lupina]KAF6227227.1 hypothetical protein HO133_008669 [Letharia lupina]